MRETKLLVQIPAPSVLFDELSYFNVQHSFLNGHAYQPRACIVQHATRLIVIQTATDMKVQKAPLGWTAVMPTILISLCKLAYY